MRQGLLHEAEDALLKAHKILAPALGTEHEETVEVISNLVDVYELSAAPGAAAAWRAKLRGQVLTGD